PCQFGCRERVRFGISRSREFLAQVRIMRQIGLMRRMSLLQIILTVFAAAGGTAAAQNNLAPDVQAMAKKVMMPLVLNVPGMDKVKVIQNLKYTKRDDPNVLMDIYLSPDLAESAKRPVVIFLHGGAKTDYTPTDWGIYARGGRLIARSGFVG